MKRVLAGLSAGLLAASMLTGCGGSTAASSADSGSAAPAAPKKVVIWDYFETDVQEEMMKTMIDGFNVEQKEYVAEYVYAPLADYEKRLTLGMTPKQLPDLVIPDSYSMASSISMGLFADVSDADIKWDGYIAGPIESTMMDDKHYGIPFATNCTALFYNKDLFDAAGLRYPDENTTWEEFHRMVKALTKNGVYGFGNAATNTDEGTFQRLQWLYTVGGSYKDIKGGVDAYKLMQEMVKEGLWTKEVVSWIRSDVNNNFMAENLAIQQNGPWQIPGIEANAPGPNHGVAILPKKDASSPQTTSILGGENMGAIKKNDVSGALAFLKYYDKTDVIVQAMKQYGSSPPKTEAVKDAYQTEDPIQAAFIKQLDISIPRGPSLLWPSYSAAIQIGFQEALASAKTPEQAVQDTQATVGAVK